MSISKQIPSLSKLYTIYEEVSENCLGETCNDSYFHHNILDIAPNDNRIFRDSKSSKENSFQTISVLQLEKSTKIHSWRRGVSFIKKTCSYFEHSTAVFETIRQNCQVSSFIYTLYPNQSRRLVLFYLKTNSLHNISETLKNIATDRYVFLFVLSITRSVVPPSKSFKLLVSKTF